MTRILLIGGTLHENFGGPSIVYSLKRLLKETVPDAEVHVLAFWRDSRIESEGYSEIPFSPPAFVKGCLKNRFDPLRRLLELYRWADVVIDYWGLLFTDAKKRSPFMRMMVGFPMLLGKVMGKPVIKYTADLGPFVSPINRHSARFYLRRLDLILARSETTRRRLEELGVQTSTEVCPDTALLLEPVPVSRESFAPAKGKQLVGLSVSHVAERKAGSEAYIGAMAALCDYLVEQLGVGVVLIANEIAPQRPKLDDVRVAREVFEAARDKESIRLITEVEPAPRLKGIIAACDIMIAARYHSLVAALSAGVPAIALSWHDKYQELMGLFGQERYVCDLASLSVGELKERVDALWSEREDVRREINKHMPAVRASVLKGARLTREIIEEKANVK